jgi:hypothetical protein
MTTDRDTELDALQKELRSEPATPFIRRPEELDVKDGSLCWLNGHRVCGADCVAFAGEEAPTPAERCMILNQFGLMSTLPSLLIQLKSPTRAVDDLFSPALPVPNPFGGKPR